MEFELKKLSPEAIPPALERAERYRLLNEPVQAESIYLDILAVEPENQQALVLLLLALSEQFGENMTEKLDRAWSLLPRLRDEYQQAYYQGEKAEQLRPHGNDEALLRWNTCARTIMAGKLEPRPLDDYRPMLE